MDFKHFCCDNYCYNAFVTKVYDGDTITCNIALGFGIIMNKQKIRLFGVNTPEVRGESRSEGLKVRDYVRNLILNKNIKLYTLKDKSGKYGRLLGIIYINDLCLNSNLLEKDYAVKFMI